MSNLQVNPPITVQKNIPIDVLIGYSEQGLSYSEIGKLVGCSPSNITYRFNSIDYTPKYLEVYRKKRADILAQKQRELLNSLTTEDIKKMAPRDKVLAYGVLYDKEQIERRGIQEHQVEDTGIDDLQRNLTRIASKSPIVINNILNVVGNLPAEIRDRIQGLLPSSLSGQVTLEGECK